MTNLKQIIGQAAPCQYEAQTAVEYVLSKPALRLNPDSKLTLNEDAGVLLKYNFDGSQNEEQHIVFCVRPVTNSSSSDREFFLSHESIYLGILRIPSDIVYHSAHNFLVLPMGKALMLANSAKLTDFIRCMLYRLLGEMISDALSQKTFVFPINRHDWISLNGVRFYKLNRPATKTA